MNTTEALSSGGAQEFDPYKLGRGHTDGGKVAKGHGEAGPASKRVIVAFGFWIFLVSDIAMFSAFFVAHLVLGSATAGGPTGHELYDPTDVAAQTGILLTSSYTCGLSAIATNAKNRLWNEIAFLATGLLGVAFLVLEAREFAGLVNQGASPTRSAYLSSFFALVGLHGIHVTVGLLWLATMMAQIYLIGFLPHVVRRLHCFNLYWHVLDIIWVAIFTVAYLMGEGR